MRKIRRRAKRASQRSTRDAQETLRSRLLAQRQALDRHLAWRLGAISERGDGGFDDEADRASARQESALSVQLVGTLSGAIRDIDHALERVAEGTHRACEECGAPITRRRLAALPSATRCVACQEQRERQAALDTPRWRGTDPQEMAP